jgi:hypothetical protein
LIHVLAWGTWAPLYKLLKKFDSFRWTEETQKVLDELKMPITKPPVLASLESDETTLLYVVATTQVISTALVAELVYYIIKVPSNCKNYFMPF